MYSIDGSNVADNNDKAPVSNGDAMRTRYSRYGKSKPTSEPFMLLFKRHSATTCESSSHATPYQSHTLGVIHGPNL